MLVLQDLTEYNTAQNRRPIVTAEEDSSVGSLTKRRRSSSCHVTFKEGEEVINPGEQIIFYDCFNMTGSRYLAKQLRIDHLIEADHRMASHLVCDLPF